MRHAAILCFTALTASCGKDLVLLHVTSTSLSIPADIDTLLVKTYGGDETTPRFSRTLTLKASASFPIDVLLEVSDDVPHELRHDIEALLGDQVVRRVAAIHTWQEGETERVTVPLDAAP